MLMIFDLLTLPQGHQFDPMMKIKFFKSKIYFNKHTYHIFIL